MNSLDQKGKETEMTGLVILGIAVVLFAAEVVEIVRMINGDD